MCTHAIAYTHAQTGSVHTYSRYTCTADAHAYAAGTHAADADACMAGTHTHSRHTHMQQMHTHVQQMHMHMQQAHTHVRTRYRQDAGAAPDVKFFSGQCHFVPSTAAVCNLPG